MYAISELLSATQGRLLRGDPDLRVREISIDSRTIRRGEAFVAIKGDTFDGRDFIPAAVRKGASCIIASRPALPGRGPLPAVIAVDDTVRALGAIARFHRSRFDLPVISVTGSNGKTTTKEMIACVLSGKGRVLKNEGTKNNHIGVPVSIFGLTAGFDAAVLELGTNHFGEIGNLAGICRPNLGVITGIGAAHLEHFGSLQGVFREKRTLLDHLVAPSVAVLNADDRFLRPLVNRRGKKPFTVSYGIDRQADFRGSATVYSSGRLSFLVNKKYRFRLSTAGYYNIYNALAAVAVGRVFGMGYREIALRLSAFEFPAGRLKLVTVGGIRFFDDTYNANPLSLAQALQALSWFAAGAVGRRIFVMGDMLELGRESGSFHAQAGRQAARVCDVFITVGKRSRLAARAAVSCGPGRTRVFSCDTSLEARDVLRRQVGPGRHDIVLVKGSRLMKMEEVLKI